MCTASNGQEHGYKIVNTLRETKWKPFFMLISHLNLQILPKAYHKIFTELEEYQC